MKRYIYIKKLDLCIQSNCIRAVTYTVKSALADTGIISIDYQQIMPTKKRKFPGTRAEFEDIVNDLTK